MLMSSNTRSKGFYRIDLQGPLAVLRLIADKADRFQQPAEQAARASVVRDQNAVNPGRIRATEAQQALTDAGLCVTASAVSGARNVNRAAITAWLTGYGLPGAGPSSSRRLRRVRPAGPIEFGSESAASASGAQPSLR